MENMENIENKKLRLETIDVIRGITIISMILYHFCWDLKYLKGFNMPWYDTLGSYIWQQSICWCFIFVAGFCVHLARNPIRNGAIVLLCGVIITAVTELLIPDAVVYYGVLTFLGSAMILVGLLKKIPLKLDAFWGFIISILLFCITKPINSRMLNLFVTKINLPDSLYVTNGYYGVGNSILTYLGFMQDEFYSTDYFSLMPWIFLFLAGFYGYGVVKRRFDNGLFHINIKPLAFIGRHSLLIYMLHQPVLYGISMLIK